jgi:DNA polymerase-4
MMLRYLFVDMNSFFASVEQQESPELRGHPVGIIPMPCSTTCCIAASYEAKAYGVGTGTPVRRARELCSSLILIVARPQVYVDYHHRIVAAVESCLHVDQICSIDEMYGRLLGEEQKPAMAAAIAYKVKHAIRDAVGPYIRCSVGLGPNVWLAKVASDMQKPDGLTIILPEQMPAALYRLKLTDLPGIAARMEKRLRQHGVAHVHQLCQLSEPMLAAIWNSQVLGSIWWQRLHGQDPPFRPTHRRLVGHSHVLPPPWRSEDRCHAVLVRMIHKAAARLRRLCYSAGDLLVFVDYMDRPPWSRRVFLGQARDTLTAVEAFNSIWPAHPPGRPFRVGVAFERLCADHTGTLPLYAQQAQRNVLADVMDRINHKYGRDKVHWGEMMGAQEAAPTRISYTQIPAWEEFGGAECG